MKLFDTHAHLGLIVDDLIEQLIVTQEARHEDIRAIINVCNNLNDYDQVRKNLDTASNVWFAVGVSPSEVSNPGGDWEARIISAAADPRTIAVGETGLDYYRKFGDRKSQIELFIRQLELVHQLNLPVIIHNREAGKDIKEILSTRLPDRGGVLHCYSENRRFAEECLEDNDNIYFSFAGNLTYRNARDMQECVSSLPLNRLLIESESPFMAPIDYRGKRNRPTYLTSTARFVAQLRNEDDDEVYQALYENGCRIFGIEP